MLREAQSRHVNEVRSLYESLVAVFPTTARFWKIFIEQEMKARNYERVEKVICDFAFYIGGVSIDELTKLCK